MDERKNDWELPIEGTKLKEKKDYNLESIYEHAHSELSLQQSKRDQIITIYLALCSFLLPFALGSSIPHVLKGPIFLVLGTVGVLFSLITVRYRVYKEVYWLCCQTITVLLSFKDEELDKSVVQRTFYHCLKKRGKGYLKKDRTHPRLSLSLFVRKNIFSSETLYFIIIALMAGFIFGLGAALIFSFLPLVYHILIGVCAGLVLFSLVLRSYFCSCFAVYLPVSQDGDMADPELKNKAFNRVFSKAWFLHFYYTGK